MSNPSVPPVLPTLAPENTEPSPPTQTKTLVEYIWLGGSSELRSKTRVFNHSIRRLSEISHWNYDGSSTEQADGSDSEITLQPIGAFPCPFRGFPNLLVFCATYRPDGTPLPNNHFDQAKAIFDKALHLKPWYGIEQEFFLIDNATNRPLGFPADPTKYPAPQGQYYCSVGSKNTFGRHILEAHMRACLQANLHVSGINAEVAPGQWEYQIGPVEGIQAAIELWVSRYILERITERFNVHVDWTPKPIEGDWNGSGCHTNFSTLPMREGTSDKTGLEHIEEAISRLSKKHDEHMAVYGTDNHLRMTGKHETADYRTFSSGRANRGASIRIGNDTIKNKSGYFEDRRPSSNMDPFQVTSILFETSIGL